VADYIKIGPAKGNEITQENAEYVLRWLLAKQPATFGKAIVAYWKNEPLNGQEPDQEGELD
jgi:hypothetical protein